MGATLSAHVLLESGDEFSAKIANLTANSLFIRTHRVARFRERVKVTLLSVTVDGEVVHASNDPPGIVVAFDAPDPVLRIIEERMHMVGSVWPDVSRNFDRQPTLENLIPPSITDRNPSEFDEPTNTGSPPITLPEDSETGDILSTPAGIAVVRDAPRLRATTVVGEHETDEVVFDEPTEDGYQD